MKKSSIFHFPFSKGFSLIELIIGLAIVLSSLLVFAAALSAIPLIRESRNQNVAYHIAAKKIEEFRKTTFSSLPASNTFADPGLSELASSTASFTISSYQGSSEIKDVGVTVHWLEAGGGTKSVNLRTLMSRNGLNQP